MMPNSKLILPHFRQSLRLWSTHGISPGGFLTAVLENDLAQAMNRADNEALENLPHIVAYLYNECSEACWGSSEIVKSWAKTFAVSNFSESLSMHDS